MIAIIGTNHDDILYFDTILSDRRKEKILNDYEVTIGRIFNQDVLLLTGVYTNYLSSIFVTYLIQKYFILLVINVGKCVGFSSDIKEGEIIVDKRIVSADIDQIGITDVKLGQIPGLPRSFEVPQDISILLENEINNKVNFEHRRATIISTSLNILKKDELNRFREGDTILGYNKDLVIDGTSAGMAAACHIARVPCISVKVVERKIDKKPTIENYERVLERYSSLGIAVISLIGNLGREDIVTVD